MGQITPALYYVLIIVGLLGSIFSWWVVQKKLAGLTGSAISTITHGTDVSGLESYVGRFDKHMEEKLKLHGYELQNYQTEHGEFVRAVRFRNGEEDLLSMRIKPFVTTIEAPISSENIQAARTVISYIEMMNSSAQSTVIF